MNSLEVNKDNKFISDEEYQKLLAEDKDAAAGYQRTRSRVGDRLYGYNNQLMEDVQEGLTEDALLDQYDSDYEKDFKWNDADAQTLQYPVNMEHSAMSNLRYAPVFGGLIGLGHDLLSSPDYSRARGIQFWESPILANSRATDRAILNSGSNQGSKAAAMLVNAYNTNTALGQAGMNGQLQNFERKYKTTAFNNDLDKTYMGLDMEAQKANQAAALQAAMNNARYKTYGYQLMDDIDARRNASLNANLTNIVQSIGNIGEEAYDEDRLKWLERAGVLRSDYFGQGKYGKGAACGGKLKKKKRGLTF